VLQKNAHNLASLGAAQNHVDYRNYSSLMESAVTLFEAPLEKALDPGKGEDFQQLLLHVIAHSKLKVNSIGIEHMTRLIRCLFKMSAQNSDCSDKSVEQQAVSNLQEWIKNSTDDTMSAVVVKEWRQQVSLIPSPLLRSRLTQPTLTYSWEQLLDLTKVVIWHIEVGNDVQQGKKMNNSRWR